MRVTDRQSERKGADMNRASQEILNSPELLGLHRQWMARLQDLFDGKESDRVFVLFGVEGVGKSNLYEDPETWIHEALDDLAAKAGLLRDNAVFRPLTINPWPYGVHFIDKLFGADVFELNGERGNWQARVLDTPVGRLQPPDLSSHPAWSLARRLAEAFLEARVEVPFLGHPVLSSPLNMAVNLYGERFLSALLTDHDAARHDLQVITEVIKELHLWYRTTVPFEQMQAVLPSGRITPPGFGQICGCSTQLLSPGLYRDFIAPKDAEILLLHPHGGMIHLCGSHSTLIPVWREMPSVRAIQVNDRAAEDLELYFRGLREDQILYVNPCAGMPLRRAVEITGGRRMVLVGDYKEPIYR
jgi:hypothetical protein